MGIYETRQYIPQGSIEASRIYLQLTVREVNV